MAHQAPTTLCINGNIVLPHAVIERGFVAIRGSKIVDFGSMSRIEKRFSKAKVIDCAGKTLIPGMVDLHVNGVGVCDITKDPLAAIQNAAQQLAHLGVTSFCMTLPTMPYAVLIDTIKRCAALMSVVRKHCPSFLGLYLEGPHINPAKRGVHPKQWICHLTSKQVSEILRYGKGLVRIMSLAPEVGKGVSLVKTIAAQGVVAAAGHTCGDEAVSLAAIDNGMRYVTHLFNCMEPLHHRAPGLVGVALTDDRVFVEMIADGVHVHPRILDLVIRAKPLDRVVVASDLVLGAEKGSRFLGKRIVQRQGGLYATKGILAGSAAGLNYALKNLIRSARLPICQAVRCVSYNPAVVVKRARRIGRIAAGYDADMVVLDRSLRVKGVFLKGKMAVCAGL